MSYESLEEDASVPAGARESTVRVHILKKKHGVIREYLNQDGFIFAVVWKGNTHPDLSKLLGSYYEEYKTTEKKHRHHRRGQGPQNTRTTKMLVHRSGHMRSLTGRAICPSLVPKNFDLGSLK